MSARVRRDVNVPRVKNSWWVLNSRDNVYVVLQTALPVTSMLISKKLMLYSSG